MAKNPKDPLLRGVLNLNTATKATDVQTYGIGQNPGEVIKNSLDSYIESIRRDSESSKKVINSNMSRSRIRSDKDNENIRNLYDIIKDQDIINTMSTLIGSENAKFAQLLKDYEMIKRCLPQVHKVINTLKNNIISPDAMADSCIGIKFPQRTTSADKDQITSLIDKYDLNSILQDIVMEYLIASVKYVAVAPFSEIPDLLEERPINEAIEYLMNDIGDPKSLKTYTGSVEKVLSESIQLTYQEATSNEEGSKLVDKNIEITPTEIDSAINEALDNIEFVRGGKEYFKRALLNEAIAFAKTTDVDDGSMKKIMKQLKKTSEMKLSYIDNTPDGMVSPTEIKKIRDHVDFRGAHIEELPAAKVCALKMRNTTICYFYVEDKYASDPTRSTSPTKISSVLDKINAAVYMKADNNSNNVQNLEHIIIQNITDKLMQVIDARFLTDNMEDMDKIYEFVKDNALHRNKKRVVFFHPDDICEFRRKDGSIMKNCMFYAKLYILTLLSNVITNVTRGADRNMYYVKTGLTTDIEGQVNSTIRAIKQNQIRYSDMGSINEIFNLVGSTVDVFMPVSVDGERPIDTETISGQNVDMNNDFLQWLMRSIIQSFGVPSSVIDDFENVDFAKTISMSNIDMAKATLDAQKELTPTLTKLFRRIVQYEIPEYEDYDLLEVMLTPPSVIVFEMNRQMVDSVRDMAETLGSLLIAPEGETQFDKRLRLFKLEYFKRNMPNLDWGDIEQMAQQVETKAKGEKMKEDANTSTDDGLGGGDSF